MSTFLDNPFKYLTPVDLRKYASAYKNAGSIIGAFSIPPAGEDSLPLGYYSYDNEINRNIGTYYYWRLLKLKYGDGYRFRLFGSAVDANGRFTDDIVDLFNDTPGNYYSTDGSAANVPAAYAAISSSAFLSLIQRQNPRYEYPWYYEYRIPPYSVVDRFEFNPKQIQNLKFLGSKLTGTAINIDSTQTVDGGPVVKVTKVNQNQIVFSNNSVTTAQANVSGLPVRQLTARTGTSGGTTPRGSTATGGSPTGEGDLPISID